MGYSIVLQLKDDAPKDKIVDFLEKAITSDFIGFSDSEDYSTSSTEYKNALYFSYGARGTEDAHMFYIMLFKLAEKYGLYETNMIDNIEYPCYYYDDILTFILTEEQEKSSQDMLDEYRFGYSTIIEDDKERILTPEDLEGVDDIEDKYPEFKTHQFEVDKVLTKYMDEWGLNEYKNGARRAKIALDEFFKEIEENPS